MKAKDVKNTLLAKPMMPKLTKDDFVSTGVTSLNLALTGKPERGYAKGHYYRLVGDSDSGKTWLTMSCLAEVCKNPNFDDFRVIYDNSEGGALMDVERFFGKKLARRMEPPRVTNGHVVFSHSIEDLYFNLDDAMKLGRPFVYIEDSVDALSSKAEDAKFQKLKKAARKREKKGKTGKERGSYGDGKAAINSRWIRRLLKYLDETGSIVIFVSQTRDSFDMFNPKTSSGGKALKFYACAEIWTSVKTKIWKNVRGKDMELGTLARARTKKNRLTGRDRTVLIPIYHSFGIDDTGACVDYLLDMKYWTNKGKKIKSGKINATEFGFKGKREKLIRHIEKKGLQGELHQLVADVWNDVEEECTVKRVRRYE